MKVCCPNCHSEDVKASPSGTIFRCLVCLYSWVVAPA